MKVPIEIFNIARTQVDRAAVRKWLDCLGVSPDFEFPADHISDPALLVALAGKSCYSSFEIGLNPNVTAIRKDWCDYLDNILKQKHGSVLEHAVYTFAIEGCSRVFTAEMNRHRAGWAISEKSLRYVRFGEAVKYWEPDSIKGPDVLNEESIYRLLNRPFEGDEDNEWPEMVKDLNFHPNCLEDNVGTGDICVPTTEAKKHATRVLFERAFAQQRDWYRVLESIWADELKPESKFKQKKELTSLFRRGIGMGCATGGIWTGNLRALRHVIAMRCSEAAEEEILHVFSRIVVMMKEMEPALFGDFHQEDRFWKPEYEKV